MRAEGTTVEGQEIAQLGVGKPLALWWGGTMLRVMQERAPPWLRIITSE
jgi:alkylated DNA nucleotide flippase Atl1